MYDELTTRVYVYAQSKIECVKTITVNVDMKKLCYTLMSEYS